MRQEVLGRRCEEGSVRKQHGRCTVHSGMSSGATAGVSSSSSGGQTIASASQLRVTTTRRNGPITALPSGGWRRRRGAVMRDNLVPLLERLGPRLVHVAQLAARAPNRLLELAWHSTSRRSTSRFATLRHAARHIASHHAIRHSRRLPLE